MRVFEDLNAEYLGLMTFSSLPSLTCGFVRDHKKLLDKLYFSDFHRKDFFDKSDKFLTILGRI